MSRIIHQSFSKIPNGNVVSTIVELTVPSDSVEVPRQSSDASGTASAAQLVRPGDPVVTVSKTDNNSVALTGNVGDKMLLVTHSYDPITNQQAG